MHWDHSNGAVIERVFTQIDSDVLTEHRQRHSFVLQLVQIFLNLFCLCSVHSRIYDTVSYQLESNQVRLSDSFLEMCSPVKFAHSLSKKSRTVSSWELCIICQISCDDTLSKASEKGKCTLFKAVGLRKDDVTISDKLKWPHQYKNWYKTILNSTQNKNKVYHKTNLNNIKLQVFRTICTGRNFFRNISEMCSPIKFAQSLTKKSRTVSNWELCIICQISCDDTLSKASEKGKCTLFKAVGLRKDDVHRRLHLIWFQLIGYSVIDPAMKDTQAK
jgi:DNA-binding transcriptional regulator YiaG